MNKNFLSFLHLISNQIKEKPESFYGRERKSEFLSISLSLLKEILK